jgi:mono/diheme cytochrome c family protein
MIMTIRHHVLVAFLLTAFAPTSVGCNPAPTAAPVPPSPTTAPPAPDVAVAPAVTPALDPAAQIERGRYLVATSACNDCHTPWKMGSNGPEPDMTRMLSGHPASLVMPPAPVLPPGPWLMIAAATNTAWAGPWGVSFTANLTPDDETGLGTWTAAIFKDTIRNGRHMGRGRPLLPPMPAPVYAQMTDQDLEAIFAYLQSIPALSNRVPAPVPPAAQ